MVANFSEEEAIAENQLVIGNESGGGRRFLHMSFALGERLSSGGWIVTAIALAIALPGLDWVTSVFEIVPLIMLFGLSIWLSVLFERRWRVADRLAGAET